MRLITLAAIGGLFMAGAVSAHHGSNGQFNHDIKINVTGKVTKLSMVNPHSYVYFDVVGDNGEVQPWRCEMRAGSLLKRTGWTEEMFAPGTEITVDGSQARREEFGCYLDTITFADGTAYQRYDSIEDTVVPTAKVAQHDLAEGTPNLNGNWLAVQRQRGAPPAGGAAGGMGAPGAEGGMGAPGAAGGMGGPGGGGNSALTEAGIAASAGFETEMNPRYHCLATNIFQDFWFDYHVNKIEQTDDEITITYGFMDIVRTIHLDMDEHPSDIVPSRAGHSIGKWEDNVLVIDTVGFEEGYLNGRSGEKHSNQMHTVERLIVNEDATGFTQEYTANDPLYRTAPHTGQQVFTRTDVAYDPYQCEDLTEERVEGF